LPVALARINLVMMTILPGVCIKRHAISWKWTIAKVESSRE
jgi:hypothetical protein